MGKRDPRIDAYIAKSAEFARPILNHLRDTVHAAVPEVEEGMKWSMPHFMHKGMMCGMAAFKQHATFGFWKGQLVLGEEANRDAMGHLGKITKLSDLPPKSVLTGYIKKAAQLNDEGVRVARAPRTAAKPVRVPPYLAAALKRNKKARTTFEAFPPSHKREYVEWITEAKTDNTRTKRLLQAVAWMAEGKTRNWRYESKNRDQKLGIRDRRIPLWR
jgi:uncharacterized protein YdeI (YjbR/CyaY-like superfamily)